MGKKVSEKKEMTDKQKKVKAVLEKLQNLQGLLVQRYKIEQELEEIPKAILKDKEVLVIREMLKGRGYNTSEKAWIGTKVFSLFGNNDKEITESICKEIEEIKKEIQKFSLFLK